MFTKQQSLVHVNVVKAALLTRPSALFTEQQLAVTGANCILKGYQSIHLKFSLAAGCSTIMSSRSAAGVERWAFLADWLDPNSGVRWTYQLFAYLVPEAQIELEMVSTETAQLVAAKPSTLLVHNSCSC